MCWERTSQYPCDGSVMNDKLDLKLFVRMLIFFQFHATSVAFPKPKHNEQLQDCDTRRSVPLSLALARSLSKFANSISAAGGMDEFANRCRRARFCKWISKILPLHATSARESLRKHRGFFGCKLCC